MTTRPTQRTFSPMLHPRLWKAVALGYAVGVGAILLGWGLVYFVGGAIQIIGSVLSVVLPTLGWIAVVIGGLAIFGGEEAAPIGVLGLVAGGLMIVVGDAMSGLIAAGRAVMEFADGLAKAFADGGLWGWLSVPGLTVLTGAAGTVVAIAVLRIAGRLRRRCGRRFASCPSCGESDRLSYRCAKCGTAMGALWPGVRGALTVSCSGCGESALTLRSARTSVLSVDCGGCGERFEDRGAAQPRAFRMATIDVGDSEAEDAPRAQTLSCRRRTATGSGVLVHLNRLSCDGVSRWCDATDRRLLGSLDGVIVRVAAKGADPGSPVRQSIEAVNQITSEMERTLGIRPHAPIRLPLAIVFAVGGEGHGDGNQSTADLERHLDPRWTNVTVITDPSVNAGWRALPWSWIGRLVGVRDAVASPAPSLAVDRSQTLAARVRSEPPTQPTKSVSASRVAGRLSP